jgi:transcriptional regulator with XRE-family HTH domain
VVKVSEKDLKKAAKELRLRLGLSQEAFGQRIGRTLNTILRYESQAGPKEEPLVRYAALAIDSGFPDLARVFRFALMNDLGPDLARVLSWTPAQEHISPAMTEDMAELVDVFVAFMSTATEDLQPAEALARISIKQMLLKQKAAEIRPAKKSK